MKLLTPLFLFVPVVFSQQPPSTGAATSKGPCSLANSGTIGSVTYTCGIGQEQGQKMLDILNRILANQLEPNAVMMKLDEILGAVNPNAAKVSYDFNGAKHVTVGGRNQAIAGEEFGVFQRLFALDKAADWQALIDLSEQWRKQTPQWLSPSVFAAKGYARLGNISKAIELLEYVDRQTPGNTDYDVARKMLQQLRAYRK